MAVPGGDQRRLLEPRLGRDSGKPDLSCDHSAHRGGDDTGGESRDPLLASSCSHIPTPWILRGAPPQGFSGHVPLGASFTHSSFLSSSPRGGTEASLSSPAPQGSLSLPHEEQLPPALAAEVPPSPHSSLPSVHPSLCPQRRRPPGLVAGQSARLRQVSAAQTKAIPTALLVLSPAPARPIPQASLRAHSPLLWFWLLLSTAPVATAR